MHLLSGVLAVSRLRATDSSGLYPLLKFEGKVLCIGNRLETF
jgi:hypothetical protein